MTTLGFGNSRLQIGTDRAADAEMGVTTYSGGWKMKTTLCRNPNERRHLDA